MAKKKKYSFQNRTKLTVTMFTLVFVAIAAITAVITVFAFRQQSISSGVKITYKASEVNATVSAWYQKENGTKQALETTEGDTEIAISGGQEITESFTLEDAVELDRNSSYVIFGYEFTNNGSLPFAATHKFEEDSTTNNMLMTYSVNGINYDEFDAGFSISYGQTLTYYVKVEIQNMAVNAQIEGTVSWDLGKVTSATGTDVTTDTARIGTTTYSTFNEAYSAAQSGDIITISEDVSVSSLTVNKEISIVPESGSSSTVVASATETTEIVREINFTTESAIVVKDSGILRLGSNNGTQINLVLSNSSIGEMIRVNNSSKLYLGNVKMVATNDEDLRAIHVNDNASLEINGGEISNFRVINSVSGSTVAAGVYAHSGTTTVLKNVLFSNNYAVDGSSVVSYGDISIDNCTFKNCEAAYNGGAILIQTSKVATISNSTFVENDAGFGGAIYGDTITITSCTFTSNTAENGGAIQGSSKINNCTFTSNTAKIGGAILGYGTINNCTFTSNVATENGGSIYGSPKINNSTFTLNEATEEGGAINGSPTITNSEFIENTANKGGAINSLSNVVIVDNCNFESNTADGGGAIEGVARITNSTFKKNSATHGGAAKIGGAFRCFNSVFEENTSTSGGAALFISGGDGNVMKDCTFTNNSCDSAGGAVYIKNYFNSFTIAGLEFTNNTAKEAGAIMSVVDLNLTDCQFSGNKSTGQNGGAIRCNATLTINSCNFDSNTTSNNGGAIYMKDGTIESCEFVSNKATINGGAIHIETGTATISGSTFTSNQSTQNGGAISSSSSSTGKVDIKNCTIQDNKSTLNGAAMHFNKTNAVVENCTITGNTASADGGAIRAIGSSSLEISGSTAINNNTASERGGAITLIDASSLTFNNGEISGNKVNKSAATVYGGGVYVGSSCGFIMNGGSIHNNTTKGLYTFGGNVFIGSEGLDENDELLNSGVFEFKGGTISGDGSTKQAKFGGGIANVGTFTMTGGTITKCVSEIGSGVSNGALATITGGSITDCVASNNADNAGKAIANNGVLNLGNVTLGAGQDIAMSYQNAEVAGISESYGTLNVIGTLTQQYTITFAQITTSWLVNINITAGSKVISNFTGGTVFATYLNGVIANTSDFVASGYNFYISNGNLYMQAN